MPKYHKLVRDRIPDIIQLTGQTPNTRILGDDEYRLAIKQKLKEEAIEYTKANDDETAVKELADVLEVVHALAELHGATMEDIEEVRKRKAEERGSFEEKTLLIDVEDK